MTRPTPLPYNAQLPPILQVTHSGTIKNEAERERNRAARQMDTLMKVSINLPLFAGDVHFWGKA